MNTSQPMMMMAASPLVELSMPQFGSAVAFLAFNAVLSLTFNTRLSILIAAWQAANRARLTNKLALETLEPGMIRTRYEDAQILYDWNADVLRWHAHMIRYAMYTILIAILLDATASFFICVSPWGKALLYISVILVWLGILCSCIGVVFSVIDLWHSLNNAEKENQFVLKMRETVVQQFSEQEKQNAKLSKKNSGRESLLS